MNGTITASFVVMIFMYMLLVPLSEAMGNANLHGVSLAVGQISSWIFWTAIFEGIDNYVYKIKELYKELKK